VENFILHQNITIQPMKTIIFSTFLILLVSFELTAQIDSTKSINLLNDISVTKDSVPLLPNKFPVTQRLLWGKKGLMRNFSAFELTPAKRQDELKIRRTMLVAHQTLGFVTLGTMIAQGIVGSKLYNGDRSLRDTHEGLAAAVNFCYFTTASLALFAPTKMYNERKGYSSIKLHKALAIVHFSAMVATNILAGQIEGNPELKKWHRAAAFTAFGAFAASMIVIKF
jgi:hypothetical protein